MYRVDADLILAEIIKSAYANIIFMLKKANFTMVSKF
jgi:hypothetical protein